MERVNRVDRGKVGAVKRTPQGYLRVDGYATRVGVFTYRNADGSERRELRPPEEVTKADSLATLAGVPITDDHPAQMLTAENTREHQRGYTGSTPKMDGDHVAIAGNTVTDAALIAKVEAGKQELSCGYTCDMDETPGAWQGQHYDAVQRNIVYNHLAVVERGRAGPAARLRFDAAEQQPTQHPAHETKGHPMTKIKIDDVEYEVSEAVAAAYAAQARRDSETLTGLQKAADDAKAEAKELTTKVDAAQAKLDAADDAAKKAGDVDVRALVRARVDLETKAAALLPEGTKLDEMDDKAVKLAVIKAVSPEAKLDGKSEAYIDARFDAATETRSDATAELRQATTQVAGDRNDAVDAEAGRARMIAANREAANPKK